MRIQYTQNEKQTIRRLFDNNPSKGKIALVAKQLRRTPSAIYQQYLLMKKADQKRLPSIETVPLYIEIEIPNSHLQIMREMGLELIPNYK